MTSTDLHNQLLQQIDDFCERHSQSPSSLCGRVINDTSFYSKLKKGRNDFSVRMLQRFTDYFRGYEDAVAKFANSKVG